MAAQDIVEKFAEKLLDADESETRAMQQKVAILKDLVEILPEK
jgi:hypothetical protein